MSWRNRNFGSWPHSKAPLFRRFVSDQQKSELAYSTSPLARSRVPTPLAVRRLMFATVGVQKLGVGMECLPTLAFAADIAARLHRERRSSPSGPLGKYSSRRAARPEANWVASRSNSSSALAFSRRASALFSFAAAVAALAAAAASRPLAFANSACALVKSTSNLSALARVSSAMDSRLALLDVACRSMALARSRNASGVCAACRRLSTARKRPRSMSASALSPPPHNTACNAASIVCRCVPNFVCTSWAAASMNLSWLGAA